MPLFFQAERPSRARARTNAWTLVGIVAFGSFGCGRGKLQEGSNASADSSPSALPAQSALAPPAEITPQRQPLPPVPFRTSAEDGLALQGALIRSPDHDAPLVILLHRWAGSRDEWTPLVELLARSLPAPSVLTLDLRGHGESTQYDPIGNKPAKTLSWNNLAKSDYAAMSHDVESALRAVTKQLDPPPSAVAIVGSDLGATIGAMVAAKNPLIIAVGVVSPGASLHGLDLYHPFADVRHRATLVATGNEDTISSDPSKSLAQMAPKGTFLTYPTAEHSAERLGRAHPELWQDLARWLAKGAFAPPETPPDE